MNINKQGVLNFEQDIQIINNPPHSKSILNWTNLVLRDSLITNRLGDGIINSKSFSISNNEIIKVIISIKTTNYVSGSGIFMGTNTSSADKLYTFNFTTKTYTERSPSGSWDTYFFSNFMMTTQKTIVTYIIGYDVPISLIPWIESDMTSAENRVIRVTDGIEKVNIRSGANIGDSTNEWTFYDLGVYRHSKVINNSIITEVNPLSITQIYED